MKKKFCILVDSSANVKELLLDKPYIEVFPLGITVGNKEYQDDNKVLDFHKIYEIQQTSYVKTNQGSIYNLQTKVESLLEKYEKIYFLPLGSFFSGLYNNAKILEKEFKNNFFVFETNSIYIGLISIAESCVPLIEANKSFDEIQKHINVESKNNYFIFCPDDISYMQKSGRISQFSKILANLFKLRIVIEFKNKVHISEKTRTITAAWNMALDMAKDYIQSNKCKISFITSSINQEKIQTFMSSAKEKLKISSLKGPILLTASALSHIGPEAIGLYIHKI